MTIRIAFLLAICLAVVACGGDDGPTAGSSSIADVKKCLEDNGLRTIGGAHTPDPEDTDAPDRGELITRGAFVAFYSSSARADALEAEVRERAKESGTEVARHGEVTVVYLPNADRDAIGECVPD